MRRIHCSLLAFLLLLGATGCSKYFDKFSRLQKPGHTVVSIESANKAESSLFSVPQSGGIMVYILGADGSAQALKLANENDNKILSLPNGSYRFLAVGWENPGLNGPTRCGQATPPGGSAGGAFTLQGSPVTVPITISTTNCDLDYFADATFRTGSVFNSPSVVFCGAGVTISGFVLADLCNAGKESHRFVKGRTTGAGTNGVERGAYDYTTSRLLYTADLHMDERFELFSVGLDGKGTVKQNPPLVTGGNVTKFRLAPTKGKVVYIADQDTDGVGELYISTIGTPGSTKISAAVVGGGIKDFRVSSDGNYAVFVGEVNNVGVHEVYAVNLNTLAAPVRLHPTPAGVGLELAGSEWQLEISPNGQKVVFAGKINTAADREIFSNDVSGTSASMIRLNTNPTTAGNFEVQHFRINYNSDKVVWQGDWNVNAEFEFFASPIGTANTQYALHAAVDTGSNWGSTLSRTADLAAFAVDSVGNPSRYELQITDFSNLGAITQTKVHQTTNTGRFYKDILFNSTNTKIAYLSDDPMAPGTYRLFSADVTGVNSKVNLSHSSASGSFPVSTAGTHKQLQLYDANTVYYRADDTASPGNMRLFKATLGSASSGTLVSQASAGNQDVASFAVGLGKVFYTFDTTVDTEYEAFYYTPGSSYTQIPTTGFLTAAKDFFIPAAGDDEEGPNPIPGLPNAVFVQGVKAAASSTEDLFFLTNYSTSSPVKLTRGYDSPTGSGKFKVNLLQYTKAPGGGLISTSEGITSSCLDGATTDGAAITGLAINIPAGSLSPSNNPFMLAVDVYADATDCSGSYTRTLFSSGFANPTSSPDSAKIKLISGVTPRLFIKD